MDDPQLPYEMLDVARPRRRLTELLIKSARFGFVSCYCGCSLLDKTECSLLPIHRGVHLPNKDFCKSGKLDRSMCILQVGSLTISLNSLIVKAA